jgi:hypothetical protein
MVLVGEGGTTALLLEQLNIASGSARLGGSSHAGRKGRVKREVGHGAGGFRDADGLEERSSSSVSRNDGIRRRAGEGTAPDLD